MESSAQWLIFVEGSNVSKLNKNLYFNISKLVFFMLSFKFRPEACSGNS